MLTPTVTETRRGCCYGASMRVTRPMPPKPIAVNLNPRKGNV